MQQEVLAQQHKLNVLTAKVEIAFNEVGFKTSKLQFVEARKAKLRSIPGELHRDVYAELRKNYPDGLYSHQAEAIRMFIEDEQDICLATSTSSGKSLAFMAATADLLKYDSSAKVIAFYPAKALIRDQIRKWKSLLEPLNIRFAFIDGSVRTEDRVSILQKNSLILMTPDVAHAWLLSNRKRAEIDAFLQKLKMLILDEAHIYDGVFGTNMSYFLRRLQAVSGVKRIFSSTATIGNPQEFIEKLTGRKPFVFFDKDDGSPNPPRAILLVSPTEKKFDQIAKILNKLAKEDFGTFLAFGDSRKSVELIVAATKRKSAQDDDEDTVDGSPQIKELLQNSNILPYRAGYEESDRQMIQKALEDNDLNGVVATSALELGIDIGDIKIVVLLGVPPTVKSFWQRFGRTGRKNYGLCILIDDLGLISDSPDGLTAYLSKKPEPEWLYLENRYIQFANALCAANEAPWNSTQCFKSLPTEFGSFLENELKPTQAIPQDLFVLKQRSQDSPHHEFPVRNGIEKRFKIKSSFAELGEVTLPQALREAYPGAVYYYMSRPYRVCAMKSKEGEIFVKPEKQYTTQPNSQSMAFPNFSNGTLQLWKNGSDFLAEVELQVSERLLGFIERRGNTKIEEKYNIGSTYYQKPLSRIFQTSGVCWHFPNPVFMSDVIAEAIFDAFCLSYGVQSRDIGFGRFHSESSPFGIGRCQGLCIFDVTCGSLRLTQKLAENFGTVVEDAYKSAKQENSLNLALTLAQLIEQIKQLRQAEPEKHTIEVAENQEWEILIARGEKAIYQLDEETTKELIVQKFMYTPKGTFYVLADEIDKAVFRAPKTKVLPASVKTRFVKYNLFTEDEISA